MIDEREYPSIAGVVVEVAKPMFYGFMVASPFLLLQGSALPAPLFAIIGVLYCGLMIWGIVRWMNWRHDPHRIKADGPVPSTPRDSD